MSIYRLFAAVAFILMALEMLGVAFPRQRVVIAICLLERGEFNLNRFGIPKSGWF
jgi:hypothetical protein